MTRPPTTVPRRLVADLCDTLGVDPKHTVRIEIAPREITVTTMRLNEHGKPYAAGDTLATTTTIIPIDWTEETR